MRPVYNSASEHFPYSSELQRSMHIPAVAVSKKPDT